MYKFLNALKKTDILLLCTAVYMILPVFIFLAVWTKAVFPLIFAAIAVWYGVTRYRTFRRDGEYKNPGKSFWIKVSVVFLMLLLWVIISGIGGIFFQSLDYSKHNAILHDMIDKNLPVHYTLRTGETGTLVYYIAYYLPAVCVGKFFGFAGANAALFVWSLAGVILGFCWLFRCIGKVSVLATAVVMLFGGMDGIGVFVMRGAESFFTLGHKEWWTLPELAIQVSSVTNLLYWVPHMFISGMIMGCMLFYYRDKKLPDIVYLITAASFLWSPFICLGAIPFLLYSVIRQVIADRGVKNLISLPMLLICFMTSVILILYVLSNKGGDMPFGLAWEVKNVPLSRFVPYYLFYTFIDIGFIMLFLKKKEAKNPLFVIAVTVILVLSLLYGGANNDLYMRATIPAIFVLCILFIKTYLSAIAKSKWVLTAVCTLLVLLMSYIPVVETLWHINMTEKIGGQYTDQIGSIANYPDNERHFMVQYVAIDSHETLFNKFFMKNDK